MHDRDRITILADAKLVIDEEKLLFLTENELVACDEVQQFAFLCLKKGGITKCRQKTLIDRISLSGCISPDEENAFKKSYRKFIGSPSVKYHLTASDCFLIIIALNLPFEYGVYLLAINYVENTVIFDTRYPDYLKLLKKICSYISCIKNTQTRFEVSEKIRKESNEFDSMKPFFKLE